MDWPSAPPYGSPSSAGSAATASELVGDNVEIADVGCRGEELVGFLREGLSNGPAKMRLACRLVRERVDNAERRRWGMTGRAQNLPAAAECPIASRYPLCLLGGVGT